MTTVATTWRLLSKEEITQMLDTPSILEPSSPPPSSPPPSEAAGTRTSQNDIDGKESTQWLESKPASVREKSDIDGDESSQWGNEQSDLDGETMSTTHDIDGDESSRWIM